MKAVKANKEYVVTEENKEFYLKQGFDIVDEDGKILEHGKGKTVSYEAYEKVLAENMKLKDENTKLKAEVKKQKKDGE